MILAFYVIKVNMVIGVCCSISMQSYEGWLKLLNPQSMALNIRNKDTALLHQEVNALHFNCWVTFSNKLKSHDCKIVQKYEKIEDI